MVKHDVSKTDLVWTDVVMFERRKFSSFIIVKQNLKDFCLKEKQTNTEHKACLQANIT